VRMVPHPLRRCCHLGWRRPLEAAAAGRTLSWQAARVMNMSDSRTDPRNTHLEVVIGLARVLERVERSSVAVDATQYQLLVRQLKVALAQDLPSGALDAVLSVLPSAAELYENMHYERSGLSRSGLERSVSSELLATEVLRRLSRTTRSR